MAAFHAQLASWAGRDPGRIAFDDGVRCIIFRELPSLIDRYASCLLTAGVTAGATVGITIRDETVHLLVTLALLRLRAHQITLASFDTDSYRESLIERVGVSHQLTADADMDPLAPAARRFELRRLGMARAPRQAATIYFTTSGTTRGPRITGMTEQLLSERAGRQRGLRRQRVLMSASIEHNTKRHRLRYLYAGATMFLASTAALGWRELARFVTRNEVTLLDLSHLEASRFAQRAEAPLAAEIHLTGARVPWRLRRQIQLKLSPSLYATYGASECGYIAIAGPGDHDEREIVGRPQPGVTVEIVAPDGTLLPRGEVGEIRVKAPGMIGGYVDDPVETAARFRGGWFHPGDMGSITPKGELIVHGRRDDMMIMNSINIYPLEVERVLETHPGVAVATAFAIKSRLHGDIPAAAVELAAGGLSEDDLMQYAQDRLGLRYPRKIVILDRMPRNTEGKILRGAIVAAYGGAPS